MENNHLKKLKSDIEKLDFNSFGLIAGNGRWVLNPNSARNGSNLDKIFVMLETLPPDNYKIFCTKFGRNKDSGFEYNVSTIDKQAAGNVHPQFAANAVQDSERFRKLEQDNAILLERLEALNAAIANLSEPDNDDDDDDDDDYDDDGLMDEPMQTTGEKVMELLAPAVPQVLDRVLAVLDNYIAKQTANRATNNSTGIDSNAQPKIEIDYELLAKMVADKLTKNEFDLI